MPDLEMSLTYEERIKLFQDRLYKVIKTVGKKKGSPGQLKLSELLPDKDENTTRQIAELLGKLAMSGDSKWKIALLSAQISIIKTRDASYKISFQYHVVPTIQLADCIPDKKKNLPIIDPPSTVLIETAENNVVGNGVMEEETITNASSCKCKGISDKRYFFKIVESDYDVISKSLNIHWTKLHNKWVSNDCCSDSADKKMRCNSCHLIAKNWRRTLLRREKNATATTSSSLTAPPSKEIVFQDMMQSIRTIVHKTCILQS